MKPAYFIPLISTLFIFLGCNNTPDPVGASFFPKSDFETTRVDTFRATQHTSTKYLLNTRYADRIMLGINTANNSWKYTAWSCLKFNYLPDSLFDATFDSAYIKLKRNFTFGDTTTNLSFNVYEALLNWTGDSLAYDSLKNPGIYYSNPLNTSFYEDTDGWLIINMQDTAIIRSWFNPNSDANKGVFLGPSETGNKKLIKGFYSSNTQDTSYLPRLIVKYRKNDYSNTYIHTIGISRYLSDLSTGAFQFSLDTMLNIQNGIAYHGNLWFDNFNMSRQTSIYRATLELNLNNSISSVNSNIYLYATRTNADGSVDFNYYANEGKPIGSNTNPQVYQFEITHIVTAWKNGATNPKLVLFGKEQNLSFDLFRFYGSGTNIQELKPRIIVTYFSK